MYITEKRLLQYGLYSNAIYVFLLFLFKPKGITLQKLIISSFLALSVVAVLVYCYRNRKTLHEIPSLAKKIFYFLMFWSFIVIVRGFSINIQDWVTNFGNVYMALAWFTPILIIAGQKIEIWKIVFKTIFFMFQLMLISLVFLPFHVGAGKLETEWIWLLRPINFIVLVGIFRYKVKYRVLIYLTFVAYIIMAVLTEQRIEFIFLFFIAVLLLIDKTKQIKLKREFLKYVVFSIIILIFLVFTYGYENITNLILVYIEFQDTRIFLYNELFSELNLAEKITGRGSLGTYYSFFMENAKRYYEEVLNEKWWGDSHDRITIEVGFLQMILKGGWLLFLSILFLMLNSCYLALFKSRNKFIKRLGLFILILSALSLISFRPAFTPTFIILWIAIGTVLNKKNRMMSDDEINNLIKI